jgi:hypothetical protein
MVVEMSEFPHLFHSHSKLLFRNNQCLFLPDAAGQFRYCCFSATFIISLALNGMVLSTLCVYDLRNDAW